ncbi:hypothetical protein EB151_10305 [archaeon]|nr:hypothetical protein [archaeon]
MSDIIPIKDLKHVALTKLPNYGTMSARTSLLKDVAKGKECVILTCGPSLNDFSNEELREKLDGKFVIAVKQAFHKVPDMVDMHVFNCNNYEMYDYSLHRPITVGCSSMPLGTVKQAVWGQETTPDLFYRVISEGYDKTLAKTGDFDDFTLESPLISNLNFFKPDGETSSLRWAQKNGLTYSETDYHLSEYGNKVYAEKLLDFINTDQNKE